jgi:hypothetical protein
MTNLCIQPQGDWTIVDQFDIHVRSELACGDFNTKLPCAGDKSLIEPFGELWRCGVDKTGSASFAAVAEQSELADDEHRAGDFLQRQVHLAVGIIEDSKSGNFFCQLSRVTICVLVADAQQYDQPPLNRADGFLIYRDTGPMNSLNACTHGDVSDQ